ncbi:unnamed protein product [Peniophora sp. CBMAI 1063]|nr:unnamed protein product [Peniophora sp. CBMAI 1063]
MCFTAEESDKDLLYDIPREQARYSRHAAPQGPGGAFTLTISVLVDVVHLGVSRMELELKVLKHPRDDATQAVPVCSRCPGWPEHLATETPSYPGPRNEEFPQEGEIRWAAVSVFSPYIKFFKLGTPAFEGRNRPFVVTGFDETYEKCMVSLFATFTPGPGEPGLWAMPEVAKFFCIQVAQISSSDTSDEGRESQPDVPPQVAPLSKLHIHTRRAWRGKRKQYAITLSYALPRKALYTVFRQDGYHVVMEEDEQDRLVTIRDELERAWRKTEEDMPEVKNGVLAKLRRVINKHVHPPPSGKTVAEPLATPLPSSTQTTPVTEQTRESVDGKPAFASGTNTPGPAFRPVPPSGTPTETATLEMQAVHHTTATLSSVSSIPEVRPFTTPTMSPQTEKLQGAWKTPLSTKLSPSMSRASEGTRLNDAKEHPVSEPSEKISVGEWITQKVRRRPAARGNGGRGNGRNVPGFTRKSGKTW